MSGTGWFADIYLEDVPSGDLTPDYLVGKWQPVLQLDGMCLPFDIWHDSREACEEFIRREIIGQGMLP
jgi:hypothetical protein